MADPSDKNNQPRREGSDEDEKAKKTSKSGEPERPKLVAVRRLQQRPGQPQRRSRRLRSLPPPPPTLGEVAARALTVSRQFLQQKGRALLALPLGHRLLFLADKALSCVRQALRWAVPRHLTQQHEEHIELPPSPLGLDIGRRLTSILWSIKVVVRTAREFLDLQRPRYRELAVQISVYRRELEGLKPARPHSVKSVQVSTAPRTQSIGQLQSSTARPTSTEAAGSSSSAVQQARVAPAPPESSSSSSSSASTGSITEEVVGRYYSPPHFSQGWTKREEAGDAKGEEPEQDDERKDSEAQESDEQSASVAEEAATVFALAPTPPPPPAGQGNGEPGAAAGAGGAQGQRRPARIPKRLLFGLFGLEMV